MPQNTAEKRDTSFRSNENPSPSRKAGRPRGAKNRPKSLIPQELANEILLIMEDQIPAEHLKYIKGVVRDGKAISTKQELDALILLLSRNLYPALVQETKQNQDGEVEEFTFRKDVTERLKVLNSFLNLRNQVEKREEPEVDKESPVLKLWADRGMTGRMAILVEGMTPEEPKELESNDTSGEE